MNKLKRNLLVLLTFLFLSSIIFAQIEHTVDFQNIEFEIKNHLALDQKVYSTIKANKFYSSREKAILIFQ